MLYKSKTHAAKAFIRRYGQYLGGGWFSFRGRKLQGLTSVWGLMERKHYGLPWSDGRVEMHYDLLDPILRRTP